MKLKAMLNTNNADLYSSYLMAFIKNGDEDHTSENVYEVQTNQRPSRSVVMRVDVLTRWVRGRFAAWCSAWPEEPGERA